MAKRYRRGPPKRAAAGALGLMVFLVHAACTAHGPAGGQPAGGKRARTTAATKAQEVRPAPLQFEPVVVAHAALLEAHGNTRVVAVTKVEFQHTVQQLGGGLRVEGTPQEAAQWLLRALPEEELLAEVYRGRVLSLVPLNDKGPLVPEVEAALKEKYLALL